jgi:glycosyltransferase involved in cell wall biosynthesis
MTPLLSICVPTYNRAARLRVMLQAVLPQVAKHPDQVELWVSDNASPDETASVAESARILGPFGYQRNDTNLGAVRNTLKLTLQLARGEFVWVLGDDDLLRPNAVAGVLGAIAAHRELDLIYLNFRVADYSTHWPSEAIGGFDGGFKGIANPELSDRSLGQWHEMVRGSNSMATQIYANVIRRRVWQDYWAGQPLRNDFDDVGYTYPHSTMIAKVLMRKPSFYVGDPVLTIFDGGESWSDRRAVIHLSRFPELLRWYQKHGLPAARVRECARVVFTECGPFLADLLQREARFRLPNVIFYLLANWRFSEAWRALADASIATGRPRLFSRLCRVTLKFWPQIRRVRGKLGFETARLRHALGRRIKTYRTNS